MRNFVRWIMANNYFNFRQFSINQSGTVFRVGTDGVLLGAWAETAGASTVLDIGTGTGLIAIMIAQREPDAVITAIEPDRDSFDTAMMNISASPWTDRIEAKNLTLKKFTESTDQKFDLIVSNPPYFTGSLRNRDEIKAGFRHSFSLPHDELVNSALHLLSENGILSLILPYAEGTLFVAEAAFAGLYCCRMTRVKPLPRSPVNRLLLEFSRTRITPSLKILTIGHPSSGGHSKDYIEIVKEFYPGF
jgi:tRNA1Val (adenine37-N6)-methyltransferase